jgi:hypothetical protein
LFNLELKLTLAYEKTISCLYFIAVLYTD